MPGSPSRNGRHSPPSTSRIESGRGSTSLETAKTQRPSGETCGKTNSSSSRTGAGSGCVGLLVAEPVEEDVLLRLLGVGGEARVVEEAARIRKPGDDAERHVRYRLRELAPGFDLQDVEDALLVAALGEADRDVLAVRGRGEPVERHLRAGPCARIDDDAAPVSRLGGDCKDRLRATPAGGEPEPALPVSRRREDERLALPGQRGVAQTLDPRQGVDPRLGGRILLLLPPAGLGRLLLERAERVVEDHSASRPGCR